MKPPIPSAMSDFSHWSGIDWLRSACLGLILLDIETISSAREHFLTPREAERSVRMGSRRKRDFIAGRVALKTLARTLQVVKEGKPDSEIETLCPDGVRPCIAESGMYCSVSHSGRMVVAVAHRHPVGIDLELVSNRTTRIWSRFLSPVESDIAMQSGLSPERAAGRAWTMKEAAAKAFGLHLFQAIHEVEVVKVGEKEGILRCRNREYPVRHAEGNGYVMSLVVCDNL